MFSRTFFIEQNRKEKERGDSSEDERESINGGLLTEKIYGEREN